MLLTNTQRVDFNQEKVDDSEEVIVKESVLSWFSFLKTNP